ncbi:MAG: penicillin-binding protein 1C [Gammaproteobacteria bacterium]
MRLAVLALLGLATVAMTATAAATPDFEAVRAAWRPSYAWLLDLHGEPLHARRTDETAMRLDWVTLEEVSPALRAAVVAVEDQRFASHAGVDWQALAAAAWAWASGGPRRGASTLSMQLAALLEPRRLRAGLHRDVFDKLAQLRAARALETHWHKDQILEAWLNRVPLRGELVGVHAAARVLFGKHPSGLDDAESWLLATLVAAPNASPRHAAARACRLAARRDWPVPCARLERLAAAVLDGRGQLPPVPALAPQFARRFTLAPGARVATTLDARLQAAVHDILRDHLAALDGRNVRDGAALVVDNASGAVLAWVGSAGPASTAAAVDGVTAQRQAGSTLKPFLYGLALERGYLTPVSLLDDSPIDLETARGLYIPQNYDRDFKGLVSVRTALASSLNVPAVRTLVMVGVEALRERLVDLGYAGITEDGAYYGYSLALGSAEVSLLEQANAYRALANGGAWSPLRFTPGAAAPAPRRVMSAPAAFLVADILADPAARALTFGLDSALATPFWSAVKTGTSKDMRDNWCIGFSDRYTVAVWAGNFEGDAMGDVSGVQGAAPAWAAIMRVLHATSPSRAPVPPPGVVAHEVRFEPAVEAPRTSWFLDGTAIDRVRVPAPAREVARITSPPNGVVIALDPDIPPEHQQVFVRSRGATTGAALYLDGARLGEADAAHAWAPRPGFHRLELRAADGRVADTVLFTVRRPY